MVTRNKNEGEHSPPREVVEACAILLDRAADAESLSNDDKEGVYEGVIAEARTLPPTHILAAVDAAVRARKRRKHYTLLILGSFADFPDVTERLRETLSSSDEQQRADALQLIGIHRLRTLAPLLAPVILSDTNQFCRMSAIHAAGILHDPVNLPAILEVAQQPSSDLDWSIVWALKQFATPECEPFLRLYYDAEREKSHRIVAAWGLSKLGDTNAHSYLIAMLDDPVVHLPHMHDPGQSLRAAQAICDIHGWPFKWDRDYVAATKKRIKRAGLF